MALRQKPFTLVAIIALLALIAPLHLLRLRFAWDVTVSGIPVPQWIRFPGLLIAGGLAAMLWRERIRDGVSAEALMSWHHIQAHWKDFQTQVKQRWSKLSQEDVARIKGHRETLIACLQERYGHAREEAQQEVRRWEHQF